MDGVAELAGVVGDVAEGEALGNDGADLVGETGEAEGEVSGVVRALGPGRHE